MVTTLVLGVLLGSVVTVLALVAIVFWFLSREVDQTALHLIHPRIPSALYFQRKRPPSARKSTCVTSPLHSVSSSFSQSSLVESCEWLNVLVAHLFQQKVQSPTGKTLDAIRLKLQDSLDALDRPSVIRGVVVRELDLGPCVPELGDVAVTRNPLLDRELLISFTLSYAPATPATIAISVDVAVLGVASLPITLVVEVAAIHGEVCVHVQPNSVRIQFSQDPLVQIGFGTCVGAHRKLENMPAVSEFIVKKTQQALLDSLVAPDGGLWIGPQGAATLADARQRGWVDETDCVK